MKSFVGILMEYLNEKLIEYLVEILIEYLVWILMEYLIEILILQLILYFIKTIELFEEFKQILNNNWIIFLKNVIINCF